MNIDVVMGDDSLRPAKPFGLTVRERQVLKAIAWGLTNHEIGEVLGISQRTVEIHRSTMLGKLRARNSPDAVRIAMNAGLVSGIAPCK